MSNITNYLSRKPKWQKILLVMTASIFLGIIGYFFLSILFGLDSTMPGMVLIVLIAAGIYTSVKIVQENGDIEKDSTPNKPPSVTERRGTKRT